MMKRLSFLFALLSMSLALAGSPELAIAAQTKYVVTDLGVTGASALAINNNGQVTGILAFTVDPTGILISASSYRTAPNQPINIATDTIPSLSGPINIAQAINNSGQVA